MKLIVFISFRLRQQTMKNVEQQLKNCSSDKERLEMIKNIKSYIDSLYEKCYNINRTNSIKTYIRHELGTNENWSSTDAMLEIKHLMSSFNLTYYKINYVEMHCINGTTDIEFTFGDTKLSLNKVNANSDEYASFTITHDDNLIEQENYEWKINKNNINKLINKLLLKHVTVDDMVSLLVKICGVRSHISVSKLVNYC